MSRHLGRAGALLRPFLRAWVVGQHLGCPGPRHHQRVLTDRRRAASCPARGHQVNGRRSPAVAGNVSDMESGVKPGSTPDPLRLRVRPELLMVLRHVGVDLLAYDGARCSEAVGPLTEVARRIEADPGLRPVLRSVGWEGDTGTGVVEGLRWVAERCADRLPGATLRVRAWEASGPLGWQGLQGQRRAAGASRAAGCEAPSRLEEPARTMRGVPARSLRHLHGDRRTRREADGLAVVGGAVRGRYSGDRRRPVTGSRARQPPRRRARVRRTRRSCCPAMALPRVNLSRLRRVTRRPLPSIPALASCCSWPGRQARRAEGAPLKP